MTVVKKLRGEGHRIVLAEMNDGTICPRTFASIVLADHHFQGSLRRMTLPRTEFTRLMTATRRWLQSGKQRVSERARPRCCRIQKIMACQIRVRPRALNIALALGVDGQKGRDRRRGKGMGVTETHTGYMADVPRGSGTQQGI